MNKLTFEEQHKQTFRSKLQSFKTLKSYKPRDGIMYSQAQRKTNISKSAKK